MNKVVLVVFRADQRQRERCGRQKSNLRIMAGVSLLEERTGVRLKIA